MFTSGKTVQVKIGGNIRDWNKCCSGNVIYKKKNLRRERSLERIILERKLFLKDITPKENTEEVKKMTALKGKNC